MRDCRHRRAGSPVSQEKGGQPCAWTNISRSPAHQAADLANEACDNGLVTVNGKPARASYDVKVGDQISLRFGQRIVTVEVLDVQETVRQADAGTLYREIGR